MKYYDIKPLLSRGATYSIALGPRSNGKSYAALKYAIKDAYDHDASFALVRRWREDFKIALASQMFAGLSDNGEIKKITKGEWETIVYTSGAWYLGRKDPDLDKIVSPETPIAYAFAISMNEHYKSTSYPTVRTIVFDEFMTRGAYLPDEFILFENIVSTIVRKRDDVKIIMLGNTVSLYSPYFDEMGLKHVRDMKPGQIDLYRYGDSNLTVAVEMCSETAKGKPSDVYFSFDNPRLKMITGSDGGSWEIGIYPHAPTEWKKEDVKTSFFILWNGSTYQGDVVTKDGASFIFLHTKTSPIRDPDHDLIYSTEHDPRPNWRRRFYSPAFPVERKILDLFRQEKVFYQSNQIGEEVRAFLTWTKTATE